jgi:hypothetical protein
MKSVTRPIWTFLAITLPHSIIFLTYWRVYTECHELIGPEAIRLWWIFGGTLAFLSMGCTLYSICIWLRKRSVQPLSGFLIFLAYAAWLFVFFIKISNILPPNIPSWMLFGIEPELLTLTLMMPAFAYAILLLVHRFTGNVEGRKIWRDLMIAVVIPVTWFLFCRLQSLWYHGYFSELFQNALIILFLLSTGVFLFLLTRIIYVFINRKPGLIRKIVIPIVVILPFFGLWLNRALDVFGDFSHPAFFILAAVNGVVLAIPWLDRPKLRLFIFFSKSMTLTFTAYLFLVFLPYLPLSVAFIILMGLGFLVLSPLATAFIHLTSLYRDFLYLSNYYHRVVLIALFIVGVTLLPLGYFAVIRNDGEELNAALNAVYQSEYVLNTNCSYNIAGIRRALNNIKANKIDDRTPWFNWNGKTPYLTALYNWYVLNNLTLSNEKIQRLEYVFLGGTPAQTKEPQQGGRNNENAVEIVSCRTISRYEPNVGAYRSRIKLQLRNTTDEINQFRTEFTLPEGTFITGYYLKIDGKIKKGLIADQRAANWVYDRIVQTNRDPGQLSYRPDGRIQLRIFPFGPRELRETEIEIIHRLSVKTQVDGHRHTLQITGGNLSPQAVRLAPGAWYLTGAGKSTLDKVTRSSAYYFIVDRSAEQAGHIGDYIKNIRRFLRVHEITPIQAAVVGCNINIETTPLTKEWEEALRNQKAEGGFNLDQAVKAILYFHYFKRPRLRPVIIVLTKDYDRAEVYDDYHAWQVTFPETDAYYSLNDEGSLYEHSLLERLKRLDHAAIRQIPVLVWPDIKDPLAYLSNSSDGGWIIQKAFIQRAPNEISKTTWENGLRLEADYLALQMNPKNAPEKMVRMVKSSIRSGIMMPLTSYIVLESRPQERALLKKEQQILATKKALDVSEPARMSEPPFILILLVVSIIMVVWRRHWEKRMRPKH